MANNRVRRITCTAPVNIAVIKYWGKRNEELILPLNSSISATLHQDQLRTKTTVAISPSFTEDRIWLNDKVQSIDNPRLKAVLKEIRRRSCKRRHEETNDSDTSRWHVRINSENNFPTAAGLASSAAGYACLAYCLSKLFHIEGDVSDIARIGSGSACRSIYGGLVMWDCGIEKDGSDSRAKQLFTESHWPQMRIIILVVNDQKKITASTAGMQQSVETSSLLDYRVKHIVTNRVQKLTEAWNDKDFETFAEITMQESNQFHAICRDTYPPIFYTNDTSNTIMQLVHAYNRSQNQVKVAYTFDAGPNACLFMLEDEVTKFVSLINHHFPSNDPLTMKGLQCDIQPINQKIEVKFKPQSDAIKYIITTQVGPGPRVIQTDEHLISQSGEPIFSCVR
ncbi:diphosphomevalonate decarboxylase-like isoform X2 [Tubulanus polymorphus]|uniref:diphosphomevalonate decarboxylase-like isoform X2 n=1 Tax=Tubulanus polymorphus TaxID=672921 RepID=UPI003DA2B0D2